MGSHFPINRAMEAEYLRAKVGDALAEGMAETAMARPADPVEYLGLWLVKYCDNIEGARNQKEIQQRYQAEEEEAIAKAEEARAEQEKEKSLQARDASELESMNNIVTGEACSDKLQASVLEFLKTKTGASAAYVGTCEELKESTPGAEGEEPVETVKETIRYSAATTSNKFLVGKQLIKNVSDKEDPTYGKQAGILTLDMFEKVEGKPAVAEGEEEPAAPEGGWPMVWKTPYVHVAECVREPRVKYFRTPKLGGYLAVPFDYNYEEDAMEEGDGPDLVEGECPAFPNYATSTKGARGMLGLDTLGTDGEFKEADFQSVMEWTKKLGDGLARIANERVTAEREQREAYKTTNGEQWTELSADRTAMAEELPALLEASAAEAAQVRAAAMEAPAEGEEAPPVPDEAEADQKLREGKIKLEKLKALVEAKKEMIETLSARADAPSRHWKVLQAVLLFAGCAPDTCDSWEKCKAAVSQESFWTTFGAVDVCAVRDVLMVQTEEAVRASIDGIDMKNVERTHVPIGLLQEWLCLALDVHGAAVEVRKAAKAKAEEAGEEYADAVEDNVTDKPAEAAAEEPAAE